MKIKALRVIPMKEVSASFYDPERDGVTFSLLNSFKQCREKTRLNLNGWTGRKSGLGLVFGSLVHGVNQRMYEDLRDGKLTGRPSDQYVRDICRDVERIWKKENPRADAETRTHLEFSMILIEALMPVYFQYWKKDFQLKWDRVEHEFKREFIVELPDGRLIKTFLKGKMDGAYRQGTDPHPFLFETKTKSNLGDRAEGDLADILPHELQTGIYMLEIWWSTKVRPGGLLYNIIRRPGQRQKKKESLIKFARRVADDIKLRPEWYFIRMRMIVSKADLEKHELELRDLVSDFILWWHGLAGHYKNSDWCQNKYGTCGMLPICARGDYTGYYKRDKVFRELTDEL